MTKHHITAEEAYLNPPSEVRKLVEEISERYEQAVIDAESYTDSRIAQDKALAVSKEFVAALEAYVAELNELLDAPFLG